jgi:MFS family permease
MRHPAPVIELDLFRAPEISLASLGQALFYAGFAAFLLGGVLFLTTVWHYSVLKAGFAFAPGPAIAALFAGLSSPFATRFGPAAVGALGAILFGLGGLWFTKLGVASHYTSEYLPALLFGGSGVGMVIPSFTASAITAIPLDRLATGIAGVTTFRQIGAALGVAMFVAVFGTPLPQQVLHAFDDSFRWMGICSFASAVVLAVLAVVMRRRTSPAPVGEAVPDTVPEDLALSSRRP